MQIRNDDLIHFVSFELTNSTECVEGDYLWGAGENLVFKTEEEALKRADQLNSEPVFGLEGSETCEDAGLGSYIVDQFGGYEEPPFHVANQIDPLFKSVHDVWGASVFEVSESEIDAMVEDLEDSGCDVRVEAYWDEYRFVAPGKSHHHETALVRA